MTNSFLTENKVEEAYLVGVDSKNSDNLWPIKSSMEELASLTHAAGAKIKGMLIQKLERPSPVFYLGRGKLEELLNIKNKCHFDVAIFNDELAPRQQRNLEKFLNVKVIDRTALILDIFAKRAKTYEGKLQVELAQHQYLLPRLAGQWRHLERLGAGIGTRGPGESQLETDRRLIKKRIQKLKSQIEEVRKHRILYRKKRKKFGLPIVALVGYTNAGKSTLLNALCKANVHTENKPFSTLDPITRQITLQNNTKFLITDTVGFIHKLPPSIVAAFRATLEELEEADILLHVVDITHDNAIEQFNTVEKILSDLCIYDKPRITVLNKIDKVIDNKENLEKLSDRIKLPKEARFIYLSALKGWGIEELFNKILHYIKILD